MRHTIISLFFIEHVILCANFKVFFYYCVLIDLLIYNFIQNKSNKLRTNPVIAVQIRLEILYGIRKHHKKAKV